MENNKYLRKLTWRQVENTKFSILEQIVSVKIENFHVCNQTNQLIVIRHAQNIIKMSIWHR